MGQTTQVMLVDDSDEARESLKMLLEVAPDLQVIAEARDGAEALQKLAVISPDVVLMDVNMPTMNGVEATEKICLEYPYVSVIVVSVQDDVEYVRRCMRAGAKDYLFKPVSADALIEAIRSVHNIEQKKASRNTVAVLSHQFAHRPKVVSFVSAKGGVGKTTIAVNTAAALAQQGKRVALVDFDLQFGDVSLFMNLSPQRTVLDLVQESKDIDPDVLDHYLTRHDCGVFILPAPRRPEQAEYITPADVRVILQSLHRKFEYVIVDTAPIANDVFFAILDTADELYMVNTLNLAVLKNNRMLLDVLEELGYPPGHMKHLLNRSNAKSGLKVRDANRVLKSDILWEMDNDYRFVETSVNEGMPFVTKDQQHRLSRQIFSLTVRIDESQGARVSRRNPLRKWFGGKRSTV